jgi:hypothetical protein
MKNIHLLPTPKPSRLRYNLSNVLVFTKELYRDYGKEANQNIYITSNEEIKEGEDFWYKNGDFWHQASYRKNYYEKYFPYSKKIILTTDPDLIKDGVQEIDDEFLEWFVKNPNCERVEFNAWPIGPNGNIIGTDRPYPFDGLICNFRIEYKIIIPQEEPKDVVLGYKTSLDAQMLDKIGLEEDEIIDISDHDGIGNAFDNLNNEPPQETLKEAAEHDWIYNEHGFEEGDNPKRCIDGAIQKPKFINGFIKGAKWQAERMYSEKEVLDLLQNFNQNAMEYIKEDEKSIMTSVSLKKWFEQHKKK